MLPTVTNTSTDTGVEPYKDGAFDNYITYCALGGLITEDDGHVTKIKLEEFCDIYGVTRMTLSRWKKQRKDWTDLVANRRNEIMPLARVTAVWNNMYLISLQSKDKRSAVEAGKLILGHNGLQLPVQRQDVKVAGGWFDILQAAKQKGVIEGEVINEPADTRGSLSDTGPVA